jgi:UDP-N-acetylmuramate dehydrogenase
VDEKIGVSLRPNTISENISLADKNWFRTGGTTRFYCAPTSSDEFVAAIEWAQQEKHPIFVLGEGANILVADEGFPGLVIRPQLQKIAVTYDTSEGKSTNETSDTSIPVAITAEAGVSFPQLIQFCLQRHIIGPEEFSGIPGSVGGACYINLHYDRHFLADFFLSGKVIHATSGKITEQPKDWFQFGYDQSTLMNKEYYLLEATFEFQQRDALAAAYARGKSDEMIKYRARAYPIANTCGSFFRNLHPEEVEQVKNVKAAQKLKFIAYYLDRLGIKGELQRGQAKVSHRHANMFETLPGAKSADIIQLAQTIQKMVRDRFGFTPIPECQLLGISPDFFQNF